jgi:hypothetical protein
MAIWPNRRPCLLAFFDPGKKIICLFSFPFQKREHWRIIGGSLYTSRWQELVFSQTGTASRFQTMVAFIHPVFHYERGVDQRHINAVARGQFARRYLAALLIQTKIISEIMLN